MIIITIGKLILIIAVVAFFAFALGSAFWDNFLRGKIEI